MLQPDFSVFPEIQTERLLLRKITTKDASQVLQLRGNEQVMRYIGKDRMLTISDAEIFVNRIIQSLNINEGINWAIALKEEPDTMIGTIGFWRIIKEHYRAEIGYMLHPNYWKKGIMKEALLPVIENGFDWLKLHSIEANINPDNLASAAVLTSTGFTREAHFKENYFFNWEFSDTAVYSKFR